MSSSLKIKRAFSLQDERKIETQISKTIAKNTKTEQVMYGVMSTFSSALKRVGI